MSKFTVFSKQFKRVGNSVLKNCIIQSTMDRIFYLSTCSTCQRIIKELDPPENIQMREIKEKPLTEAEIDEMKAKAGSYEAHFSRRAMKYRALGLQDKELKESDYRDLILKEYTFLKRPVIILGGEIFVGNSKKTVEAAKMRLKN